VRPQLGPEFPFRDRESVAVQTTAHPVGLLQHQGPDTPALGKMGKTETADAAAHYYQIIYIAVH
jgi:hypothetical protein